MSARAKLLRSIWGVVRRLAFVGVALLWLAACDASVTTNFNAADSVRNATPASVRLVLTDAAAQRISDDAQLQSDLKEVFAEYDMVPVFNESELSESGGPVFSAFAQTNFEGLTDAAGFTGIAGIKGTEMPDDNGDARAAVAVELTRPDELLELVADADPDQLRIAVTVRGAELLKPRSDFTVVTTATDVTVSAPAQRWQGDDLVFARTSSADNERLSSWLSAGAVGIGLLVVAAGLVRRMSRDRAATD